MSLRTLYILLILFFLPFGGAALAQTTLAPQATQTLSVDMSPAQPRPGETVRLQARSFSIDLNSSEITWFVNDEVVRRGTGATEIQVNAGNLGGEQRVVVRATTERVSLEEEVLIRPTVIDLVWEAVSSYAPPLYRGKTLAANNGAVRVVALPQFVRPNGEVVSSDDLIFTWSRNGRVLGSKSGTGKNTVIIEALLPFREAVVSVEVRSLDDALYGSAAAVIEPVAPNILLYEEHPLLGTLFNNALGAVSLSGRDEYVAAVFPYFMNADAQVSEEAQYTWSINGQVVDNPSEDPASIVLRRRSSAAAAANVEVEVSHSDRILQRATGGFSLSFTEGRAGGNQETENVF